LRKKERPSRLCELDTEEKLIDERKKIYVTERFWQKEGDLSKIKKRTDS